MEQIRYVKIPTTESRTEPDTHIEYALQVQGPVRSWTVWHRYNDFAVLAYELGKEFPGVNTPCPLPPKSISSWFTKLTSAVGSSAQIEFIEERRRALERYLQAMITSDDSRWRASSSLQNFLAPVSKSARHLALGGQNGVARSSNSTPESEAAWVTAASWLDDQRTAEQIIRDVRQSLLKRENALSRNEVSTSHQCTLQAKRRLSELGKVLKTLETGLEKLKESLSAGEHLRRQDILTALNEERTNLNRMVLGPSVAVSSGDKAALLEGASSNRNGPRVIGRATSSNGWFSGTGSVNGIPGAMPTHSRTHPRSRRVFGNTHVPQETNETRGLDNQGLLQLQEDKMKEQDLLVSGFSNMLQRQREMGEAIGSELELQNQLLTDLDHDVDRTTNKLAVARRQANQLK